MGWSKYFKQLFVFCCLLGFWIWASKSGLWSDYVLPSPQKVWMTFKDMLVSQQLTAHIKISLKRVLIGYSLSFTFSFFLAIIAVSLPKVSEFYSWIINLLKNIPPISLIPLLILWFGIGETPKLVIIVLASFFPMYLNISNGFAKGREEFTELCQVYRLPVRTSFFKVMLPAALPDIILGMKIGLSYAWRSIIGAEMIAASAGLGYFIEFSKQTARSDKVIVGIITIALLGWICDLIFRLILKVYVEKRYAFEADYIE